LRIKSFTRNMLYPYIQMYESICNKLTITLRIIRMSSISVIFSFELQLTV
jgi:hypothetical protein